MTDLWDILSWNMLQCDSDLLIIPFSFWSGLGLMYPECIFFVCLWEFHV